MSIIEEQVAVAPWVGFTCSKNELSVVVLSSNVDIIEKISTAITEVHSNGNFLWKLIVLRCFQLEDVIRQSVLTGRIAIDFVIVAVDTSQMACLEWTKKVLAQVHPSLRIRRTVLVNASGLPVNAMAVNPEEIISLQSELKLDMLNANVFSQEDAAHLARRLLKYIEVSVGVKTGIPNLNI